MKEFEPGEPQQVYGPAVVTVVVIVLTEAAAQHKPIVDVMYIDAKVK